MASVHIPAWEPTFALSLQVPLHEIPRKEVDILPKFNGEGNYSILSILENMSQLFSFLILFKKILFAGYFHSHSKVRLFVGSMFFPHIQFIIGHNLKSCLKMLSMIMIQLRLIKILVKWR